MKFDSVLKICKANKRFVVFRENPTTQWLGDDSAVYLTSGYPKFTPEYLTAAASLTIKDIDSVVFRSEAFPDRFDSSESTEDEKLLNVSPLTINFPKGEYTPVFTSKGIRFIKTAYFEPFKKEEEITIFERETAEGDMYFVVKVGMFVEAIIIAKLDYLDITAVGCLEKIANKAELARKIMEEENEEVDSIDED